MRIWLYLHRLCVAGLMLWLQGSCDLGPLCFSLSHLGWTGLRGLPGGQSQDSTPGTTPPVSPARLSQGRGHRAATGSGKPRPPFHPGPALRPCFLPVPSRQAAESGLGGWFTRKRSCGCGQGDPRHGCGVGRASSSASLRGPWGGYLLSQLCAFGPPAPPTPGLPGGKSAVWLVLAQLSKCTGGPIPATLVVRLHISEMGWAQVDMEESRLPRASCNRSQRVL